MSEPFKEAMSIPVETHSPILSSGTSTPIDLDRGLGCEADERQNKKSKKLWL